MVWCGVFSASFLDTPATRRVTQGVLLNEASASRKGGREEGREEGGIRPQGKEEKRRAGEGEKRAVTIPLVKARGGGQGGAPTAFATGHSPPPPSASTIGGA